MFNRRPSPRDHPTLRPLQRYRTALRHPQNWFQLGRFVAVGASGFVINMIIFTILVHPLEVPYILAAVISNAIAIANNFFLHRLWTFKATNEQKRRQGLRFLAVCMVGFAINLIVLRFGVEAVGLSKVFAEVIAAGVAAPVTFVINRQWAFREARRSSGSMARPLRATT